MAKERVKLKDIARETGFTINTVSRALNDTSDISVATKKLIKEKAYELGYTKNVLASSLRTGQTKTIAVIVGDIANPLFAAIIRQIEKYAAKFEYSTIIFNTDEDPKLEKQAIISAFGKTVDGIIICPSQRSTESVKLLMASNFPFVLMGRYFEQYDTDYVITDDVHGAFCAVEFLIKEHGCKKILFLNGSKCISSSKDRLLGYKKALKNYNIEFDKNLIREFDILTLSQVSKQMESIDVEFDGVFTFSDLIALRVLTYWRKFKPDNFNNIPIIGYDDILNDLPIPYPLTSIGQNKEDMAKTLVDIIIEKILKKSTVVFKTKMPTQLVKRV